MNSNPRTSIRIHRDQAETPIGNLFRLAQIQGWFPQVIC